MKRLILPIALLFAVGPVACDDDDSDTSDSSNNDDGGTAPGDDGADDAMDGGDEANTSSSMEVCESIHECLNDVCTCQTPGMEDEPCTDDMACEDECEVCM